LYRRTVLGFLVTGIVSICYLLIGNPSSEIIRIIRSPEFLLTFSAGSILAVSGVIFQNVLSNPLADPYILGISAGSGLGAVIGFYFGKDPHIFSLLTGIITVFLLLLMAKFLNSKLKLLLFGVGLNTLFSSLIVFLIAFGKIENFPSILFFLMGFIPIISLKKAVFFLFLSLILLFILLPFSKKVDALALGDSFAYFTGINPEKERIVLIFITSVFIAFTISQTGIIGFVGIVIPHIGRFLKILRTKKLLLFSFFAGGNALLIAKSILKFGFPTTDIPVGTVTALIGAPIFIGVLVRSKRFA